MNGGLGGQRTGTVVGERSDGEVNDERRGRTPATAWASGRERGSSRRKRARLWEGEERSSAAPL
ncbi:hypothetical protein Zm00014a_036959 [Zea mays]|uniref:Uncharacterized protein n=1 Tax=Zea mays TaxID=4577 RepID=A0A3L6F8V3_MAIZE|nr:hypothetical protein Zm00014a_036959 [Zea mays]